MTSVVIVGGGIVGVSLADALARRGHDVTLLERRSLGAGTSGKSIGCFMSYLAAHEAYRPLIERAWELYAPSIDAGEIDFHRNGLVVLATSDAYYAEVESVAEEASRRGVAAELLDPDEVTSYGVAPEATPAGAVAYPEIGRLDPSELVASFAASARDRGTRCLVDAEVIGLERENGAITGVRTADATYDADLVVNAAGPWGPRLNAMAGVDIPLGHTRAPILVLEPGSRLELPTVLCESGLYFTGERSGTILAGHSPHESASSGWKAAEPVDDPDRIDRVGQGAAGAEHLERVAAEAGEIVPALEDASVANEWCGVRCVTPDEFPVAGPTGFDGFLVATGMSGVGITVGPAVAAVVSEYVDTGELAHRQLDPRRFR